MSFTQYSQFTLKSPPVSGNFVVGLDPSASSDDDKNVRIPVIDFAILSAANTFGDFNQTFKDNRILIESPDGLTPITFVNSQQTLARNLTIPILTANRNLVVSGETSQITLGTEVTGAITNLSDVTAKTGSGTTAVFDTSPVIVTPTIASFVNAGHSHLNAAGGGTITAAAISDFNTAVSTNSDVTANTAKVTNATHTGDVTGATALTLQSVAITGQTLVTAITGDFVLISDTSDSGNLKKVNVSDFLAGQNQTPWLSDIDADGFDLRDLSNIEFRTSTGAPAGSVQSIYADAGGIILNIPTGDDFDIQVNAVSEYSFDATQADFKGNIINLSTITLQEISNQAAMTIVDDVVTAGFKVQNTDGSILLMNGSSAIGGFSPALQFQSGGDNLTLGQIISKIPVASDTGAKEAIRIDGRRDDNSVLQNRAILAIYNFGTKLAQFESDGTLDLLGNNLVTLGIVSFDDANTSIQQSGSDLQYDVATGGTHDIRINNALEYEFSATQANFNSNNIVNLGTLNTHTVPGGTSTFALFSDNLSVFAATTSAQLLGVISDETGSGLLVFGTSPTIVTPTIASFVNATHDHSNAAGGGNLTNSALTSGVFAAITGLGAQSQNLAMGTNLITGIKSTQFVQNTITYNATQVFDFNGNEKNQITLTGVLSTLTTTNRAPAKSIQIFIIGDSVDRLLTFNTSWRTNPGDATVTVTANTFGVLSLYCRGTAETDVFAVYAEFS